ncbi:MAG: MFS transporter [Chloroflexi bacterium]|nr:MFS transporter [Chloroflexota bacterium]
MTLPESPARAPRHIVRSLVAVIAGSLVLRAAAGAMGENIQFYFNEIHRAAMMPDHPLRLIAGAANVYEISYTLGGIIIGTFFAAELIASPLFGAWSDKYGRKLFIIFGPLFGAIAVQITAMTTLVWLLIVTRLLEGLSTAANAPSTLGYLAEATAHSPKLRARVVGLFEVATIGGMAVGLSLGGWLWRHYGTAQVVLGIPLTSPAFALNAVVYAISLFIFWFGMHEIRERQRSAQPAAATHGTWSHYWKIISSPRVASFAPAWIAINAVLGVFINLTARILTDEGNFPGQLLVGRFDAFQAGNIRAAYAVVFVIGILLWSLIFAQMRKTTVMLIGTGGLFLTCVFLYLLNHQPALDAPLVTPLAALLFASILIQSGFTPAALAHLADITEDYAGDRGAIMGLYSVFLGLGQFIGASIGGPFVDWGGADGIVVVTALLGLFSAAMLGRLHVTEGRLTPAPRAQAILSKE